MKQSLQDGRPQRPARVHWRPAHVYFQCNFYTKTRVKIDTDALNFCIL